MNELVWPHFCSKNLYSIDSATLYILEYITNGIESKKIYVLSAHYILTEKKISVWSQFLKNFQPYLSMDPEWCHLDRGVFRWSKVEPL